MQSYSAQVFVPFMFCLGASDNEKVWNQPTHLFTRKGGVTGPQYCGHTIPLAIGDSGQWWAVGILPELADGPYTHVLGGGEI